VSKWDCSLEEERISSSSRVEMVTYLLQELQDPEPMFTSTPVQPPGLGFCGQWRWNRSGEDGEPSVVVEFSFAVVSVVPEFYDKAGYDGDQTEKWARRCAYNFIVDLPSISSYLPRFSFIQSLQLSLHPFIFFFFFCLFEQFLIPICLQNLSNQLLYVHK